MEFLTLLGWMLVAHAVCDYPLQGDFLAKAKNAKQPIPGVPWGWAMSSHCAIHAGAVGYITGSPVLAALEFGVHFVTDDAKCRGLISFSVDQWMHVGWKVVWAACALYHP